MSADRHRQRYAAAAAAATAAVAVALAGCTMIPRYQRPTAPVAAQFPGAAPDTAAGVPAAAPSAAEMSWRSFVNDERLRRLIGLALVNNRDLRVAVLNVEQARAQYHVTRAGSFPTINGSGGYTAARSAGINFPGFTSIPGFSSASSGLITRQWSASIGTNSYELDLFGRVRSLNQQALEKFFASAEAQRDAQITLVAEVATQYFTLREADEQLKLAQQTLVSVQGAYDLNKISFDAGENNELDLRTAEGQVQTAKINVVSYQRARAQALDALVLLVGRPLPADLPAPPPFDDGSLLAPVPPGLPSDLVQRRPDILEAEHTLKAANANIGAARAAFFPTISLTGSLGTTSTQLSGLFGAGNGTWNFAPQISVPIFAGGQNRANLDVARISTRIEVADYEKAIQTAFREVADALVADDTYARQIAAEMDAIKAQQRRLELATLRYRQGEDTYLNVLSAQQDLYSAQQGRLQAQFNRLSSQIALYQALGGGWK
jgi:multidrug efflux system outer membrane protein